MVSLKSNGIVKKSLKVIKSSYTGWLFIMPMILGTILFCAIPFVQSFILAFMDYDMMRPPQWIGIENFKAIFTVDFREVWGSFRITFIYAFISIPVTMFLSYFLALLLNRKIPGMMFFRVLIYLPCIIPPIASAIVWKDIFAPQIGIMNRIVQAFGLPASDWLSSASSALMTIIFMSVWGLGGGMILWLAAFKNIPVDLYEAASLDGASKLRQIFSITIPMSSAMIFYNLINGVIGSMQMFGSFLITDNGGRGPDNSLYFISVRIYQEAFVSFNMGYASALAWILFFVIACMSALLFKHSKWVFYGEDM